MLICDIYTIYIVIVVENKGRNKQFLLNFIAKDLLSLSGAASGKGRTFLYCYGPDISSSATTKKRHKQLSGGSAGGTRTS